MFFRFWVQLIFTLEICKITWLLQQPTTVKALTFYSSITQLKKEELQKHETSLYKTKKANPTEFFFQL